MKSLFGDDYRYSEYGLELDREAASHLKDLFDKYLNLGYSPREISHIIQGSVRDLELEAVLNG